MEVDWWAYRGSNPSPTPEEVGSIAGKAPSMDPFDEPVEKVAAVPPAEIKVAEAPRPPSANFPGGRPPVSPQSNSDEFPPVLAKVVRFTVTATDNGQAPGLDEFEIFGADPKVNLALKGVASASSTIANYPIHKVEHLNDGKVGNDFSWVGAENGQGWVRIDLPEKVAVQKVVWARDRTGSQRDRLAVGYRVEVSTDGADLDQGLGRIHPIRDEAGCLPRVCDGGAPAPLPGVPAFGRLVRPRRDDVRRRDDRGAGLPIADPPARPAGSGAMVAVRGGLNHPIGIEVVKGRIYVSQKPEITELIDLDGDGVADEYRTVATGWGLSREGWHEYCFGLADDRAGHLYFALTTGRFWTHLGNYVFPGRYRGSIMRVGLDDGRIEVVAKGCRVPNGIVRGPDGQIFYTDNQGDWIQSCKLAHVVEGRFYGHPEYVEDALPKDEFPTGAARSGSPTSTAAARPARSSTTPAASSAPSPASSSSATSAMARIPASSGSPSRRWTANIKAPASGSPRTSPTAASA